ncbi:hypothetical protein F7D09_1913 [Bifidobacterium leontopitheci]|uniref:Uncharacterized protein n=1 Tax=Bifidobacterium leontopitheci TaxID=2650774 RepID=A0A6I1GJK8_9BIFI|nr:hypothetical protein F7D09_1913 [Bifidobacterium leontopitheci]
MESEDDHYIEEYAVSFPLFPSLYTANNRRAKGASIEISIISAVGGIMPRYSPGSA